MMAFNHSMAKSDGSGSLSDVGAGASSSGFAGAQAAIRCSAGVMRYFSTSACSRSGTAIAVWL